MEAILLELSMSLLNGLGLMALVAVIYGIVERLRVPRLVRSALQGVAFGCGAAAAMATPAMPVPGVLIDSRATFVAVAGAFSGPLAAVIAAGIGAAYRIGIGGAGVVPGLVTLSIALLVGLAWRYAWYKRRAVTPLGLVLLGLGISAQNALILIFPLDMPRAFLALIALAMTLSALFATLVLCGMMQRENRIIAREKSLFDDAYTDALTGLPNRRAVLQADDRLRALSQAKGYVVLLVDVDHFKSINDRFGHDVGDTALCVVANLIRSGAREGDVVSRFGGEEFVVVLPGTSSEEGWAVAERIAALVRERRVVLPDADFSMTISVGFAHARNAPLTETIARGDEALYRAKAEGRDRIAAAAPARGRAAPAGPMADEGPALLDPR